MKFKIKRRPKVYDPFGVLRYRETEIEVSPEKVFAADIFGADILDHPQWLHCDCCLAHATRLWLFEQPGFCMANRGDGADIYREGHWGMCVFCLPLFNAARASDPCRVCGNPRRQHRPEAEAHHSECTLEQFETNGLGDHNMLSVLKARVLTLNPKLDERRIDDLYRIIAVALPAQPVLVWESGQPYRWRDKE